MVKAVGTRVGDEKKFLRTFSQGLKDCFGQSWHDKLKSSDKFFEYKLMKQNFGMEVYICSMKSHLRDALLRFRAGVSWIKAHRFRFKPGADTSCPFCPHETEDELHVLCKCTTYNNIRPDFLSVTVCGVVFLTIQLWKQLIKAVCSRLHCFLPRQGK